MAPADVDLHALAARTQARIAALGAAAAPVGQQALAAQPFPWDTWDEDAWHAGYEQARRSMMEAQWAQAAQQWAELCEQRVDVAPCHYALGVCLQALGWIEQAGQHFSWAYALDPSDAATCFRLAECLAALGEWQQAREALAAARQLAVADGTIDQLAAHLDALQAQLM